MKSIRRNLILAGILAAALLGTAGCKAAATQPGGQSGNGQNTAATVPVGMSGTRGIITEISSSSITIAVMPQGAGVPNGGGMGQPPQGSAQPDASGAPQQPQPSGTAGQGAGPQATQDTSTWQKETFAIDASTKISQGQGPGATATASTSMAASDLKAGDSVLITERTGTAASTADQITVMQGMGGPGAAPTATANS